MFLICLNANLGDYKTQYAGIIEETWERFYWCNKKAEKKRKTNKREMTQFWKKGKNCHCSFVWNLLFYKIEYPVLFIYLHKERKMGAVTLTVALERHTKWCSARFRYLSPGSEGGKCRLIDHTWQIPFTHSAQFLEMSHFHIYVCVPVLPPCGT